MVSSEALHYKYIELAADIVCAYVSSNEVPSGALPKLLEEVHLALLAASTGGTVAPPNPVVSLKKSISDDYIICLEDGKKFKSLTRHLRVRYGMTPQSYREKWGLPPNYPMICANYSRARSFLAKEMGLGNLRNRAK